MDKTQKDSKSKYKIDMCEGPILGKMLKFTIPLIFSGLLQLLFHAADIIVVGNFGREGSVGAVGSTSSLINLLTNLFIGLSVGTNVVAARYYGAKQDKELSKTVHTAIFVAVVSGLVMTVVGMAFTGTILEWMGTPGGEGGILERASAYLRILFAGMLANMVYNFGAALLRAVGDTRRPLYYLMISGVVNVGLNLWFVIGLDMDVSGVALATVISQCLSAVLVIRCLMREEGGIRLTLRLIRPDRRKVGEIVRVGLPAGVQGTLFSLSNVVIQSAVNSFGPITISGNAAASNIEGFVYVAMNSFYQATLAFASQNYGKGQFKRILKGLLTGLACVTVTGIVLGNGVYLAGDFLLGLYTNNSLEIEAGMRRLAIICVIYALCGIMDVMVGAIRGIGYSVMPMIVSLLGACGFRLLYLGTIFKLERFHKIETVYMSYPISWLLTILAHIICFTIVYRKALRRQNGGSVHA